MDYIFDTHAHYDDEAFDADRERCFRCLEHCNPAETPYCITKALINAAEGKIDEALLFCGSNAYRCEKIETVPEVMAALCGE